MKCGQAVAERAYIWQRVSSPLRYNEIRKVKIPFSLLNHVKAIA